MGKRESIEAGITISLASDGTVLVMRHNSASGMMFTGEVSDQEILNQVAVELRAWHDV